MFRVTKKQWKQIQEKLSENLEYNVTESDNLIFVHTTCTHTIQEFRRLLNQ